MLSMLRSVLIARLILSVKELIVFVIGWLIAQERNKQLVLGFSWDYYYLTLSLHRCHRCPHL